jgi:Ca2+-binding RTX toxin-like protein
LSNGGFITAYLFSDFTFDNDGGELSLGQNGPFTLPSDATASLSPGAAPATIEVLDDDPEFDDGFQDNPGSAPLNQFLASDLSVIDANGDPVTVSAGTALEVEFTLTATPAGGGDSIDLLFVAAGPDENAGDLTLVATTAPLTPGETYDIEFKNDGGSTPYEEVLSGGDGVVDGEESGETMTLGYDDSNPPTDGGGDKITNGDDVIEGNGGDDFIDGAGGDDTILGGTGNDTIDGGDGNDVIYGDDAGATSRESFNWEPLTEGEIDSTVTQDTGSVEVTYARTKDTGDHFSEETDATLNTTGIDTGSETIDPTSGLRSNTQGQGNEGDFQWEFSKPVTDVQFNVNDIDGDGVVRIQAFDENGDPIEVQLVGGSELALIDTDTVAGADTADSDGGYDDPDTDPYNLQVTIPGPVSKITLEHDQDGPNFSGVYVTDIYFTPPGGVTGPDGNDVLDGGEGDDMLFGEGGSDILTGGLGADMLDGGGDDDDLVLGSGDSGFGGGGDDVFLVDPTDTEGPGSLNIVGGETDEGGSDTTNDNYPGAPLPIGDVLDLRGLNIQSFSPDGGDPASESGTFTYLNDDGELITGTYAEIENVIICFVRGTMIETLDGPRPIEDLEVGDAVITLDSGVQKLRWIGSRTVAAKGNLAPIRIAAGALGNDRDLYVSPQHRMLIDDWRAELFFNAPEVLVAAKHLVNGNSIQKVTGGEVEYFHLLFDRHEIVMANGALSESFHPGEIGMGALENAAREEILQLFPELREDARSFGPAARTSLKAHEGRLLSECPAQLV